jgi:phenylalanine-4-hydroxylase
MNATAPRRVEHQQTDKGYVPVYTTAVVEQPWSSYSQADHTTWAALFERQREILKGRACREFIENQERFGMTPHAIPRFDELNEVLAKSTGWELIGVEGLLPELTFFDHLANRRFPVTWWIREEHEFSYIVEPDVFHDFFGHVPMLLDPTIADFLELYGRAGARAMEMDALDMLARIYWYTIEFGLVREGGDLKVFGAGIISSSGETRFSLEDRDVLRLPFEAVRVMRTGYMIDSFQKTYFVLESLPQLIADLVSLDFGPVYETWRTALPIPAGDVLPGETPFGELTS